MSDKKVSKNTKKTAIVVATVAEAIKQIKELGSAKPRKFIESVDLAVNLSIDSKKSDQNVKGSIVLPSGSGKKVKVLVFAGNDAVRDAAQNAGATIVGLDDLIEKINNGFLDFDCCIATPDVMHKISKVAKKLGPRGLMPSPKNGTVTTDVKKAVEDAIKGKVDFKNDKAGIVHCAVGKINFKDEELLANIKAVMKAIKDAKPESFKGKYIKNIYLTSTMGPSVTFDAESIN